MKLDNEVQDVGEEVGYQRGANLVKCQEICDKNNECKSFTRCLKLHGGTCYFKNKQLGGYEPLKSRADCYSYYRPCDLSYNIEGTV